MTRPLLYLLLLLMSGSTCLCQSRGGQDYHASIEPIMEVLRSAKVSGSLEYWGSCNNEHQVPDFPPVAMPSSSSGSPLQVLSEMFAKDENMQVTQGADGTVRMVEKGVPQDLLNVKIKHISFDEEHEKRYPMYFPGNVLWLITHSVEVQAFMKDHDIRELWTMINESSSAVPRVSGELNNVTLSEALDYMLKTFPGIWVYENCPGNEKSQRVVVFAFYRSGQ